MKIPITLTVLLITLAANVANSQVVFNNTYGQMPYNYGKKIIQAYDGERSLEDWTLIPGNQRTGTYEVTLRE